MTNFPLESEIKIKSAACLLFCPSFRDSQLIELDCSSLQVESQRHKQQYELLLCKESNT